MNLQLNPSQALALYETIVSVMTNSLDLESNTHLEEIKQKLHEHILSSMQLSYSSSNGDKFSNWLDKEQEKIAQLNADLEELRVVSPRKKKNKSK